MRTLLQPGGVLAVVGLARSRSAADVLFDLGGAIASRLYRLRQLFRETSAAKLWPPAESYSQIRQIAARVLPGSRYHRHLLWRYSLLWTKPNRP